MHKALENGKITDINFSPIIDLENMNMAKFIIITLDVLKKLCFNNKQKLLGIKLINSIGRAEILAYKGLWKKIGLFLIYRLLKGFYSPLRIFFIIVLIIITCTLLYSISSMNSNVSCIAYQGSPIIGFIPNFLNAFYFSTITFTTVGYGDIIPHGWLKIVAAIEAFLGIPLIALLGFVFGNKYKDI